MFTFLDENVDKHVLNNVIDQTTADRAKEFYHSLPLHLPPPHTVPSEKGLTFYWFYRLNKLEACLDVGGHFTWAGHFDTTLDTGIETWDGTMPVRFADMLARLYEGSEF